MPNLQRRPLAYFADSSRYFEAVASAPNPVFIDSGKPHSDRGRYSIISADPTTIISIAPRDNTTIGVLLSQAEAAIEQAVAGMHSADDLPFCGGAIGCINYELGEARDINLSPSAELPLLHVGIYDWAIIVDHHTQCAELVLQPGCQSKIACQLSSSALEHAVNDATFMLTAPFHSHLDWPDYARCFEAIQRYILDGDCYQINLTRQFSAPYSGSPWQAYKRMRKVAAAPFSAYLDLGECQLLSLSPERFIEIDKGSMLTQPIKGTAPRSPDPVTDKANAEALEASEKNRAENVMIVDLLRNDLGKNSTAGSVQVERLLELQSFNTVHHLVSTIRGTLNPEITALQALLDCFPGGSITGAPKRRAMEIIAELEPNRRSLYCGSVFYLSASGRLDSSITIRSFVCHNGQIRGWAGGGIVADSEAKMEFVETEEKLGKLMAVLAEPE